MGRFTILPLAIAIALTAAPAAAQHGHAHSASPAPAAKAVKAMADGEVRKVDRVQGTVTIKHGALEALGMGLMTMPFAATDPKLLANVKEGDKVRFEPGQTAEGKLTVSKIEVVK